MKGGGLPPLSFSEEVRCSPTKVLVELDMDFLIDVREKDGLRTLHFEGAFTQGAMRVDHPRDLALEYTRVMMACLLLREGCCFPDDVLLIGLGAGSLAKFLYHHCPTTHLTVVEIEPRVVEVARQSFHLPVDDERLEIVIGDGAEYVRNTDRTFDLIMVDGFNEYGHTGELNTLPFYQACRTRLSAQGLLAVNLVGISHGRKGGFAHIEAAFHDRAAMFPRCKSGNTIAFAATGERIDIALDELARRAQALEARTGLDLLPSVTRLTEESVCQNGRLVL